MKVSKLKFSTYVGTVLLGGITVAGCNADIPVYEENDMGDTSHVTLSFIGKESVRAQGRASIDEDNLFEKNILRWDAGDKVTLWMGKGQKACTFITEQGGLSTALFTYTGERVDTKTYFGFYPYQEDGHTNVNLSIPVDGTIRQVVSNNSKHLASYRAMYTKKVTREVENNTLSGVVFKPLTSLLVFNLVNNTGESVVCSSISLEVERGVNVFYSTASYEAGSDKEEVTLPEVPTESGLKLSLGENLSAGMSVDPIKNIIGFMPLLPSASLTNVALRLVVTTSSETYTKLFSSGSFDKIGMFEAGKYYRFNMSLEKDGLIIDTPMIGEWEDGGTVVVPIH